MTSTKIVKYLPPVFAAAFIVGAAALAGCAQNGQVLGGGAANTAAGVSTVIASPEGQSLLTQIETGFGPKVQGVISKINAGVAVVEKDKKYVCAGASMLHGLFRLVATASRFIPGSQGLIPPDAVSTEGAAMVGVNAVCSGAATDIVTAAGVVANTYIATASELNKAGVPVTVPVSAPGT